MKLFTIGYEKRGINEFIDILLNNRVEILIDIRAIPHSRNKDYAKKNLEKILNKSGIEYLLIGELGSPSDLRKKVKSDGDFEYFFKHYDKFLKGKMEPLMGLANIAKRKKACLLCYEADFNCCHRRSVAERVAEISGNLEIIHL